MNKWIWLVFTAFLAVACSSKEDVPEVDKTITITDTTPENDGTDAVSLQVVLNTVNMRKSPSMRSPVIEKLAVNSKLEWLKQVSEVTAPIKLRGVRYNDPWLYVKSDADNTGWIYAATAKVASKNPASDALNKQLLNRRVSTFFGEGIETAINGYRKAYAQAQTSDSFANVYTYGLGLRDKIVQILEKKATTDPTAPADMSWLDDLLPGYSHARVAEGTAYYLFADYKKLENKTKQTQGDEDDQFIDLNLAMFPSGQESFFPAWIIQTTDYSGESRLGSGTHQSILEKLNSLTGTAPVFSQILTSIKHELIKDMTNSKTKFSEPADKRKQEVSAILGAGYSILTDEDKTALQAVAN